MNTLQLLLAQIHALQTRNAELEALAFTDALTGCLNRHSYDRRVQRLSGAETFVYIDLCRLGLINNTLGHTVADGVLARVGSCLRSHFDQIYRTGGDELVAVLDCDSAQADQIMARVETALDGYRVGAIPVVLAWGVGQSLEQAEAAMYEHKRECDQLFVGIGAR